MKCANWLLGLILVNLVSFPACTKDNEIGTSFAVGVTIPESAAKRFQLDPVSPNPINGILSVQFRFTPSMRLKLRMMTEDWQVAGTLFDEDMVAGSYRMNYDLENLPSGTYFLVLEGDGAKAVQSFQIMK